MNELLGNNNYESELSDILFKSLCKLYNIKDYYLLFRYFYLRCKVNYAHINKEDFLYKKNVLLVNFLIEELNICNENKEYVVYKNQKIYKKSSIENSLENIIDEWEFRASLYKEKRFNNIEFSYEELIKNDLEEIFNYANNKSKAFKKTSYYIYYYKYNALYYLNKKFNVNVRQPFIIKDFKYNYTHNFFKRTLEEQYSAYKHSFEINTQDVNTITELDLKHYLSKNLHLIETGLILIQTEFVIKNGRIDILALDNNKNYVIIELKTKIDKNLIWQVIYYQIEAKRKLNTKHIRVFTVCSEYPEYILQPLDILNFVEKFNYTAQIQNQKIESLKLKKIK